MRPIRTFFQLAVFLGSILFGVLAIADATGFKEGVDYTVLDNPVAVTNPEKIEVREFFWFGCPHCYQLEAKLAPWREKLPADVNFVQTPAPINPGWVPHAHAFYIAEALGKTEEIAPKLFEALHVKRKKVFNKAQLGVFFEQFGVDRSEFDKLYESFSVRVAVRKANALAKSYQLTGVPALIVNGKYIVQTPSNKPVEHQFAVADYLIAKERAK